MLYISEKIESICGKQSFAYSFEGLYIDREKESIYCTNGKQVVRYTFGHDEFIETYKIDRHLFIPLENWKNLRKGTGNKGIRIEKITENEGFIMIHATKKAKFDHIETFKLVDDPKYPDIDKYILEAEKTASITIDPKMLLDLYKATHSDNSGHLTLEIPVKGNKLDLGAQKVYLENESIKAFTMPVRTPEEITSIFDIELEEK